MSSSCRRDTGNLEMFLDSAVMISSRMGVLHFWSLNTEIPDAIRASQQCLVVAGVSKCSVTSEIIIHIVSDCSSKVSKPSFEALWKGLSTLRKPGKMDAWPMGHSRHLTQPHPDTSLPNDCRLVINKLTIASFFSIADDASQIYSFEYYQQSRGLNLLLPLFPFR